jgi:hypothetical protein
MIHLDKQRIRQHIFRQRNKATWGARMVTSQWLTLLVACPLSNAINKEQKTLISLLIITLNALITKWQFFYLNKQNSLKIHNDDKKKCKNP